MRVPMRMLPRSLPRASWLKPTPERALWGVLVLALAGAVGGGVWSLAQRNAGPGVSTSGRPGSLPVYGTVPAFTAVERSGRPLSLDALAGKVWIANFIFTSCTATCPAQTATLERLQRRLASEPDLRLVSVSIDPDRDTPAVLSRYAERFHADPVRWLFLTGEERALHALARDGFHMAAYAVPAPAPSPTPLDRAFPEADAGHSPPLAKSPDELVHDPRFALVDRRGRIRGYYSSLDPEAVERLVRNVKDLLAERA